MTRTAVNLRGMVAMLIAALRSLVALPLVFAWVAWRGAIDWILWQTIPHPSALRHEKGAAATA